MSFDNSTVIYTDNYKEMREQYDQSDIAKLEQAIFVHGYRGASSKKHNGVVVIRPSDKNLWKKLKEYSEIEKAHLNFNKFNYTAIKVVAHVPAGDRLIGYMYKDDVDKLIILGVANYN